MNCAYHPDLESVAFCVTCGRALCASCRRDVEGSVYCETCLADMVRGGAPASGTVSPGGDNPGAASALGLIPGVGAIYNAEFFKAAAPIIIFGVLISITDMGTPLEPLFGLLIMGFYIYMPFEVYYTAKKRQPLAQGIELETPIDRFHEQIEVLEHKEFWGGVALVVVGALFLMDNLRVFRMRAVFELWPLLLIAAGAWLVWNHKEEDKQAPPPPAPPAPGPDQQGPGGGS
jgi:hypothetical protein